MPAISHQQCRRLTLISRILRSLTALLRLPLSKPIVGSPLLRGILLWTVRRALGSPSPRVHLAMCSLPVSQRTWAAPPTAPITQSHRKTSPQDSLRTSLRIRSVANVPPAEHSHRTSKAHLPTYTPRLPAQESHPGATRLGTIAASFALYHHSGTSRARPGTTW